MKIVLFLLTLILLGKNPIEDSPPKINGITLGAAAADVLKAFGDPQVDKKIYDDARIYRILDYGDISFFLIDCAETQTCDVIEIEIRTAKYRLENGMRIGLSKDQVFDILGRKYTEVNSALEFVVGVIHGYRVTFENESVSNIVVIGEFS